MSTVDYELIEVEYHDTGVVERIHQLNMRPVIDVAMSGEPPPPPEPPPAPVVSGVYPTESGVPSDPGPAGFVGFELTFAAGTLTRALVAVEYPSLGFVELAHDGSGFLGFYEGSLAPIQGGTSYRFRRLPVWPSAPRIRVYAIAGGEEL